VIQRPEPLGVGCTLLPSLPGVFEEVRHLVGVVEMSPDMFCQEVEDNDGTHRMRLVPSLIGPALEAARGLPVIVHGLELSIGSASGWNTAYLAMLDQLDRRCPFQWHSEHLGFLTADNGHAGVPLPLPFTREAADLVARRADTMCRRYHRPFLLENAAYYLAGLPHDPGWDEATFLASLTERADCGLLLDLFNLHVNCTNHGLDALDLLARVPLDRVVEIHVAGGDSEMGYLLDSHSAAVPEEVWKLLVWVLERAPNVAAVIFEVLDQSFHQLGFDGYVDQITRANEVWASVRG
jgi:uncharacterized protein (UPF0276 family)